MSAEDAARRFAAERPPIRRGAAFDRPPRQERPVRPRRAAPVVEQYEEDGPVVRRQQLGRAPEPARKGVVSTILEWAFYVVLILAVGGFALWAIVDRMAVVSTEPQQAMPTAGVIIVAPPSQADYGIPAFNATQEARQALPAAPTATEQARPPATAVAVGAADEGGEAIEAGRVAAPVAPIIRATQTAAPVVRVEAVSAQGGEAIEAGRVAQPVVRIAAPTVVAEGGTAAGAGSFARKVRP